MSSGSKSPQYQRYHIDTRPTPDIVPYPGGNLFSLASGGAIYVRDPQKTLSEDQLNGGEFTEVEQADWQAILPYLKENENQFGITVEQLLDGRSPGEVYRKIQPKALRALQAEEAWVREHE